MNPNVLHECTQHPVQMADFIRNVRNCTAVTTVTTLTTTVVTSTAVVLQPWPNSAPTDGHAHDIPRNEHNRLFG